MANVYVDLELATGDDDGSSWANAYQTMAAVAAGVSAGDIVYLQGDATGLSTQAWNFPHTDVNNPVIILGCKEGTSAEPPAQSDLVPGWRTGDASRAWEQTAGNAAPTIQLNSDTSQDVAIRGCLYIYGVRMYCDDDFQFTSTSVGASIVLEECTIGVGQGGAGDLRLQLTQNGSQGHFRALNCEIDFGTNTGTALAETQGMDGEFIGCVWNGADGQSIYRQDGNSLSGTMLFHGCDFSDSNYTLAGTFMRGVRCIFRNCKLNASTTLLTSPQSTRSVVELIDCSSETGIGTGESVQTYARSEEAGTLTVETTIVRTGGADDGADGAFSYKITPSSGDTVPNYHGFRGPELSTRVEGDGTAKTVSVYINNASGSDLNNDDVWLEVLYPSADGDAAHDWVTTQMDLLDTPAAITDDSTSWGASDPGNAQVLSASISPDYTGLVICRVIVATGGTDAVYVDPRPVIT